MLPPSLPATNAKRLHKGATGSRECAPDNRFRDMRRRATADGIAQPNSTLLFFPAQLPR